MKISELIEALQQLRNDFQGDDLEVIFAKCDDVSELEQMKEEGMDCTNAEFVNAVTISMGGAEPYCVLQMNEVGDKELGGIFGKIIPYSD